MFRFRSGRRPHILVVDDEPDMCWTLENILRPAGYAVTTTTSGAEAIEKAQGRFFNLALLDIRLPDMEGIELVAPLKKMHPDMVVMIVTAYASLETAVQALNNGASAYITKPLNVDEVLATVRGGLEKQRLVMEKRQVEEALRESEARYRLLAENANDAIYMLDSDLRITDVNPFTEQAIGYSQDELIGRSFPELGLLAPASLGLALEDAARVLAGERISRAVYEFITKGGRHLFGEVSGAPIYQEGQVVGVLAIARDITERKRAEKELKTYQLMVESAHDAIFFKDLESRYIVANRKTLEAFGLSRNEVIGKNDYELMPNQEEAKRNVEDDQLVFRTGEPGEIIKHMTGADGKGYWFHAVKVPQFDDKGNVVGLVGIARDITKRKRAERLLQALNQAALAMGKAMRPEGIFTTVAEELKKLGFFCTVLLTDESRKRLFPKYLSYEAKAIKAAEKLVGLKAEGFSMPVETVDVYRKVVRERETVFVENAEEVVRQLLPGPAKRLAKQIARMLKVSKSIDAPLIVEDETIGLLLVQSDDLTEDDIPAITAFAHQMAAAWRKAQLMQDLERSLIEQKQAQEELQYTLEKLREALGGIIQTVTLMVETRDPYTAGHQRRVADLARAIANEMGLPQEQIDGIRMAGLIHDLGKINVPAEILSKPTRLTEFERGMIQTHPQVGYDILKTIDFPWPVAQIVLQHHERMDGSGYPQGLSGEEIMLEARVLAVADVVEAMASFRPYRPAHGIDKALEEISQNRGALYDAEAVDACLKLFTEKGFKFE